MANDHGEQIRIVQETVAGKEITFAHVRSGSDYLSETWIESTSGLSFFCNWNYEYDSTRVSSYRI
jgi:hypothetical protein